jgi:CRP/FNR family transcriptional regulator, global nitrogen regulator
VAEPVFTISRGKVSRTLLKHYVATSLPPADSRHLVLEDFEGAGIQVADRCFTDKDIIFAPGDPDDQVYFLLEGTVRLYKIYGVYKEGTVALLREGDVFGELGLEKTSCQNAFAEAVTDARVAVVRKTVLIEVIKRRPKFALKLFSSFSERLRQSEEAIESLLYREVSTRLATLLSHLADRFGEPHGSGTVIRVRLTHQELANMIFSTREAVSKVMSEFQRADFIEIRNRRIVVNRQLETLY